jgi:hypothetical protein
MRTHLKRLNFVENNFSPYLQITNVVLEQIISIEHAKFVQMLEHISQENTFLEQRSLTVRKTIYISFKHE